GARIPPPLARPVVVVVVILVVVVPPAALAAARLVVEVLFLTPAPAGRDGVVLLERRRQRQGRDLGHGRRLGLGLRRAGDRGHRGQGRTRGRRHGRDDHPPLAGRALGHLAGGGLGGVQRLPARRALHGDR